MTNKAELVSIKPEVSVLEEKPFEKRIQKEWVPQILEWAAQGDTLQKMADKIKEKWGKTVTPSGVRWVIRQTKLDRSETSKAVVRENIGTYITNDLEIIKNKKEELVALSTQFKESADWKNYFQTVDKIKDYSKMLFDLSGVHETQNQSDADNAKQDLLDMFEKFGER